MIGKLGKFVGSSAIYAVGIGLQFVTIMILARSLGPTEFGYYSVYTAVGTILIEVLAVGSGDLLIKNVALRPKRFSAFFGNSLLVTLAVSLPCALLMTWAVYQYGLTSAPFALILLVVFGELVFSRFAVLSEQCFIGHKKANYANLLRLVFNAIRMLAALPVLLLGWRIDFFTWAQIQSVSTVIAGGVVLAVAILRLGRPRLSMLTGRLVEGLPFSGTQIIRMTQLQVDRLLIGFVAPAYVVGIYGAASRVISLGTLPMVTLLRMTYPHYFVHGAKGMRNVVPYGLKVLAGLLGVAACTALAFYLLAPFLPVLLGEEYADAVPSAQLLSLVVFAHAFIYAGGGCLSGANYQILRLVATMLNLLCIAAGILILGGSGDLTMVVLAVLLGNAAGAGLTWVFVLVLYVRERTAENRE